jgi:hypothetical protein
MQLWYRRSEIKLRTAVSPAFSRCTSRNASFKSRRGEFSHFELVIQCIQVSHLHDRGVDGMVLVGQSLSGDCIGLSSKFQRERGCWRDISDRRVGPEDIF